MRRTISLLCGLAFAGCGVGSVQPFYRPNDVVLDSNLIGSWQDSANDDERVVIRVVNRGYTILYRDEDGKTAVFEAHLFRLGTQLALDVLPAMLPASVSESQSATYWSLVIRLHGILLVAPQPNRLVMRAVPPDDLKQFLEITPAGNTVPTKRLDSCAYWFDTTTARFHDSLFAASTRA